MIRGRKRGAGRRARRGLGEFLWELAGEGLAKLLGRFVP